MNTRAFAYQLQRQFAGKTRTRSVIRWYGRLPRHVAWLFVLVTIYVALPLIDVPLLGLSLSAPIFFLIIGEVFLRGGRFDRAAMRRWKRPLSLLGAALIFTFLASLLIDQQLPLSLSGLLLLVRYVYWLVVFAATAVVVSNLFDPSRLMKILSWAVVVLAVLRLGEMARFGIGANPALLTKNSYGFIFSCFGPFVLVLALDEGRHPFIRRIGFAVFMLAVLLNLSRGNWLALLFGLGGALYVLASAGRIKRGVLRGAVVILVPAIGLAIFAPTVIMDPVQERALSFSEMDEDKSVLVRRVMVQKSLKLFLESPIVGVGPGRFQDAVVSLELPSRLRYYSQAEINRRSSHNSWAQWLAETGLVGSLALGSLLLTLGVRGFRASKDLAKAHIGWGVAPWAGMIAMCVHLWAVAGLTGTLPWFLFGMVAGAISWRDRFFGLAVTSRKIQMGPMPGITR